MAEAAGGVDRKAPDAAPDPPAAALVHARVARISGAMCALDQAISGVAATLEALGALPAGVLEAADDQPAEESETAEHLQASVQAEFQQEHGDATLLSGDASAAIQFLSRRTAYLRRLIDRARRTSRTAVERDAARKATMAAKIWRIQDDLVQTQRRLAKAEAQLERIRSQRDAAQEQYRLVMASTSWRVTGPLRDFVTIARRAIPRMRRLGNTLRAAGTHDRHAVPPQRDQWALMVEWRIPMPQNNSFSAKLFHILKILRAKGYEVFFISAARVSEYAQVMDDPEELEPHERRLREEGVTYTFGLDAAIEHLKDYGRRYRHAFLFYADVAQEYAPLIRQYCPQAQIVFDCGDLHFIRLQREAQIKRDPELVRRAEDYRRKEVNLFNTSDVVVAISEEEKAIIRHISPTCRIELIRNIFDEQGPPAPLAGRHGIVFIGNYLHSPNPDAVHYFIDEIFPVVRRELGDVEFLVVGSNMTDDIKDIRAPGVRLVGFVNDPAPTFAACRVFVAPLRFGAGVKGKVGQAMSYGLPMVITSIAAEGMALQNGTHALIEDDPARFAAAVVRLYRDPILWADLSMNSQRHIRQRMSIRAAAERLDSILGDARQ
jgi:glycosyltransferase involved in cell wall biosynthesis